MIKQNRKANFWIRSLATFLDLLLFCLFLIASSFLIFNYKNNTYLFSKWLYYPWLLSLCIYLCLYFIVIPIVWKGKTLGMFICRIKIIKNKDNLKFSKVIFDRQRLFSFSWICIFLLFLILIHPDTFLQALSQSKPLSKLQKIFLAVPGTLASLVLVFELFLIFTNLKSSGIGLNDKLSSSYTVWINKYDDILSDDPDKKVKIKPKQRILPHVKIE